MPRKRLDQQQMSKLCEKRSLFKVNLPSTKDEYRSGNGEGIWAAAEDEGCEALWKNDASGAQAFVYACNTSVYYFGEIEYGSRVLVEFRGKNRPVAVWDDLQGTKDAETNKEKAINELLKRRKDEV